MSQDAKLSARNIYKEYRQTRLKIGESSANAQYIHSQSSIYFLLLTDFFHLQTIPTTTADTDHIQLAIRSAIQLLSKESFINDHGHDLADALDYYEELERELTPYARRQNALQQVLQGCLYLPTRCLIIKSLVRYRSLDFDLILDCLLKTMKTLPTKQSLYLSDVIYAMIEEQPAHARRIRYKLTELRILPGLVLRLTVNFCTDDYVDFLNGVFNSQPTWFLQQSYTSGTSFAKIKTNLMNALSCHPTLQLHPSEQQQQSGTEISGAHMMATLRALCGLVAFFGVKLVEQETRLCLTLLAHAPSEMLLKMLLCLVLVSADQMMKYQKELIDIITRLIQSGSSEMPLLLMAYFQTDDIGQVEDMVRTILRMQVPIPKLGLFEMQKLFKVVDSYI